jgi:hypothetical protein
MFELADAQVFSTLPETGDIQVGDGSTSEMKKGDCYASGFASEEYCLNGSELQQYC